jgi:hypothetical protein
MKVYRPFYEYVGFTPQMYDGLIKNHKSTLGVLSLVCVVGFILFVVGATTGTTTDSLFIAGIVMLLGGLLGLVALLVYVKRTYKGGGNMLERPVVKERPWDDAQYFILTNCPEMFQKVGLAEQSWKSRNAYPHMPGAVVFINNEYRVTIAKLDNDRNRRYSRAFITNTLSNSDTGLKVVEGFPQSFVFNGTEFEIIVTEPCNAMLSDLFAFVRLDVIGGMGWRLTQILNECTGGNVHLHNLAIKYIRNSIEVSEYRLYLVDVDPYEVEWDETEKAGKLIEEIQQIDRQPPWVNDILISPLEKVGLQKTT